MSIGINLATSGTVAYLGASSSAVIFVLLCMSPLLAHAQDGSLSLADSIQLALAHNRSIQSAALDVDRADASVKAAATRRLPSFLLLANAGESLTRPYVNLDAGILGSRNGTPLPQQEVKLQPSRSPTAFVFGQALESLTGQYQLGLEVKSLEVGREISNQRLRASKQEIVNRVRQLYWRIVDDESAIQTADADIELYSELERVTKVYVAEKTALASDLLDIQGHLLRARYERTSAANTVASHKEELNELMGQPIESEMTLDSSIDQDFVLPSQKEAIASAMTSRPDLKQTGLQAEQADLDRRAEKAKYIPDVSLEASYVALAGTPLPIEGGGYAEAGVQLRWEPFDWGRKHHEIAEKTAIINQAHLNATDLEAKARIEVNAALRNAQAASELLQAETINAASVGEALRMAQEKYAQRAVLLDEVLKLESSRQRAQQTLLQARTNLQTAYSDLMKAMGEDQ